VGKDRRTNQNSSLAVRWPAPRRRPGRRSRRRPRRLAASTLASGAPPPSTLPIGGPRRVPFVPSVRAERGRRGEHDRRRAWACRTSALNSASNRSMKRPCRSTRQASSTGRDRSVSSGAALAVEFFVEGKRGCPARPGGQSHRDGLARGRADARPDPDVGTAEVRVGTHDPVSLMPDGRHSPGLQPSAWVATPNDEGLPELLPHVDTAAHLGRKYPPRVPGVPDPASRRVRCPARSSRRVLGDACRLRRGANA
jgi:hypothetical protein